MGLNGNEYRTLKAIFDPHPRADIPWLSLKTLMTALGGTVKEYGDRVCVAIESNKAVIHRRGQQTYLSRHAVECIRDFLKLTQFEGLIK